MIIGSATDTNNIAKCGDSATDETFLQSWREEVAATARNVSQAKPNFGFYIENCPFHVAVGNKWIYYGHEVPVDDGSGEKLNLKDLLANFQSQSSPKVGIDNMNSKNPSCNS